MQKYLDQLKDNLIYENEIINGKTITVNCRVPKLPYYIKDYKIKKLKDLNYGDKFVVLKIKVPIYYKNKDKTGGCFIHPLTCCVRQSRRTNRLNDFLLENIKESSAIGLERTLKKNICDVSDTSIIRLLKKNNIVIPSMKKQEK